MLVMVIAGVFFFVWNLIFVVRKRAVQLFDAWLDNPFGRLGCPLRRFGKVLVSIE